jgi:hypothetical protein
LARNPIRACKGDEPEGQPAFGAGLLSMPSILQFASREALLPARVAQALRPAVVAVNAPPDIADRRLIWGVSDRVSQRVPCPSNVFMPTRRDEMGSKLNAASFASVWSSAKLVELSVFELVHRELS